MYTSYKRIVKPSIGRVILWVTLSLLLVLADAGIDRLCLPHPVFQGGEFMNGIARLSSYALVRKYLSN